MRLIHRLHGSLAIYPDTALVETRLRGRVVVGYRPDTDINIAEATAQGYTGPAACWQSLVEHELLHLLMAEWLGWADSPVLTHEAGLQVTPYGMRLYEEALVLAFQRWLNSGDVWPALTQYTAQLAAWKAAFAAIKVGLFA